MRHEMMALLAGAALLVPVPGAAQSLAARVNAAPADATVRFTFESRPGVCGNGENISIRGDSDDGVTLSSGTYSGRKEECIEGPVQMEIRRSGNRIIDARPRVGGSPRAGGTDLGTVDPEAAVAFLLSADVLTAADSRASDRMVFAAVLANAESWPGLLSVARTRDLPSGARKSAVFWLAQAAGDRATEGLTSIVGDDSDEMEVRKQAVFALSQIRSDDTLDALMDIARTNAEPELRKNAMFWLGQTDDPRVIAFFEEILRG